MLNICISFDHEIFFGENFFSENEILFKPTYRLMEVLVDNNVSGTFFTDVCSVLRYKSLRMAEYPELMETQLKNLTSHKQDIQLHIHSHWYKSEYKNGKWNFDENSYRIHSFGFNNEDPDVLTANKIIKDTKVYLETLLKTVDPDYKCIAFRAGGFCLQPEQKLLSALIENGIIIDSSVVKHLNSEFENHSFSFLNVPKDTNWWINPEGGIERKAEPYPAKNIFEVPIGSLIKKPLKWYLSKSNVPFILPDQRGTYIPLNIPELNQFQKIRDRLQGIWSSPIMLSLDSYRDDILIGIIKEYLKDQDCSAKEHYISVICHPKIMGDDHISNVDSFIKKTKKISPHIKFTSMREIYNNITNA